MGANDCCCGRYNAREGTKLIGVASACLAVIGMIPVVVEMVKLSQLESSISVLQTHLSTLQNFAQSLGGDSFSSSSGSTYDNNAELRDVIHKRRMTLGSLLGSTLVTLLVSIVLVFAAMKNNRCLALPFMIWTILTQIATGISLAFLVFFCAVTDWSAPDINEALKIFVAPLIVGTIYFVLCIWFLVVVFNFYKLLKNGQAFDSIPMQTA